MPDNIPDPKDEKPVEPKVEVPVEEKEPEYAYKDVHEKPVEEIAKNKEVPEEKSVEPTDEEKAKIEADAKAKAEAEAKEEEVEIKPEELVEEISTKVAEKLTPEEKAEVKDKYTEFFEKTKAEKGRDPNWIELSQFLEEQAVLRMEEKQAEAKKEQEKQKEEETKATEAFTKRFNSQIDEEIEELYKSGNLTPIKDSKNPSDQGVIERKALFQAMLDTNQKRAAEGKDAIFSVARIFYGGYYTKPNAQPAGSEAPVSMGTGTPAGGEEEQEVNYMKDVKRPWSMFRKNQ